MVTKKEYLMSLVDAFRDGKYIPRLFPPILLAAFGFWAYLQKWAYFDQVSFALVAIWLLCLLVMTPYEVLNKELAKRDADNQLSNPRAYAERTYVGICRLIKEGEKHIQDKAPHETWEQWDKEVQKWLATRANQSWAELYLGNSRPQGDDILREPEKALVELRNCLDRMNYALSI